jgi:hypothetical protein
VEDTKQTEKLNSTEKVPSSFPFAFAHAGEVLPALAVKNDFQLSSEGKQSWAFSVQQARMKIMRIF